MTHLSFGVSTVIGEPRTWLEDNTHLVSRVVSQVARHRRLQAQDADELLSGVFAHLVKDDYRVLRQFRGTSNITTYLSVVVQRVLLDSRTKLWGRWRPTVRARKLGATAVALERMVVRDGIPCDQANAQLGMVASADGGPARSRLRRAPEALDAAKAVPAPAQWSPSALLEAAERRKAAAALRNALRVALQHLADGDCELIKLRHASGLTIAAVARSRGIECERLYRRYEQLYAELRRKLEALGVFAASLDPIVGAADVSLEGVLAGSSGVGLESRTRQPATGVSAEREARALQTAST
jgi:RNA polymerase sigma factor (sigma-70 family)